jgi:hypothetical protein
MRLDKFSGRRTFLLILIAKERGYEKILARRKRKKFEIVEFWNGKR